MVVATFLNFFDILDNFLLKMFQISLSTNKTDYISEEPSNLQSVVLPVNFSSFKVDYNRKYNHAGKTIDLKYRLSTP